MLVFVVAFTLCWHCICVSIGCVCIVLVFVFVHLFVFMFAFVFVSVGMDYTLVPRLRKRPPSHIVVNGKML